MEDPQQLSEVKTDVQLLLECLQYNGDNPSASKQAFLTLGSIFSRYDATKDFFQEIGGLQFVFNHITSITNTEVKEAAFFCLGCCIEKNVLCQKTLTTAKVFGYIHGILSNESFSYRLKQTVVFFMLNLVSNNGQGQVFAKSSRCLADLLELLRTTFPKNLPGKEQSKEFSCYVDTTENLEPWSSIASTICMCVNNPCNEENQKVCGFVLPFIISLLKQYNNPVVVQPLMSLIGFGVASNTHNQEQFRRCGGLHVLVSQLEVVTKQMSESNSSEELTKLVGRITSTIDSCISDNIRNAKELEATEAVPMMLVLLKSNSLNMQEKLQIVLTLGHAMELSEGSKEHVNAETGLPDLVKLLTDSDDEEFSAAVKYLLQMCISKKNDVLNEEDAGAMEIRFHELKMYKKIDDISSRLNKIEQETTKHTREFQQEKQTSNTNIQPLRTFITITTKEEELMKQLEKEREEKKNLEDFVMHANRPQSYNSPIAGTRYILLDDCHKKQITDNREFGHRYPNNISNKSVRDHQDYSHRTPRRLSESLHDENGYFFRNKNSNIMYFGQDLHSDADNRIESTTGCQSKNTFDHRKTTNIGRRNICTRFEEISKTSQYDGQVERSQSSQSHSNLEPLGDNIVENSQNLIQDRPTENSVRCFKDKTIRNSRKNSEHNEKREVPNSHDIGSQTINMNEGSRTINMNDCSVFQPGSSSCTDLNQSKLSFNDDCNRTRCRCCDNRMAQSSPNTRGNLSELSQQSISDCIHEKNIHQNKKCNETQHNNLFMVKSRVQNISPEVEDCNMVVTSSSDGELNKCGDICTKPDKILSQKSNYKKKDGTCTVVSDDKPDLFVKPIKPPPKKNKNATPQSSASIKRCRKLGSTTRQSTTDFRSSKYFDSLHSGDVQCNKKIDEKSEYEVYAESETSSIMDASEFDFELVKTAKTKSLKTVEIQKNKNNDALSWANNICLNVTPLRRSLYRPAYSDGIGPNIQSISVNIPGTSGFYSAKQRNMNLLDKPAEDEISLLSESDVSSFCVTEYDDPDSSETDGQEKQYIAVNEDVKMSCPGCTGCLSVGGDKMSLNSRTFNILLETNTNTCSKHRAIRRIERKHIEQLKRKLGLKKRKPLATLNRINMYTPLSFGPHKKHNMSVYDMTDSETEGNYRKVSPPHTKSSLGKCKIKTPSARRSRVPYTEEEENNLVEGVKRLGTKWNQILVTFKFHPNRTSVDLKEKYNRMIDLENKTNNSDSRPKCKKIRKPFSMCEERRLVRGVKKYGYNWKTILHMFTFNKERSSEQLRNCWRNMHRKNIVS